MYCDFVMKTGYRLLMVSKTDPNDKFRVFANEYTIYSPERFMQSKQELFDLFATDGYSVTAERVEIKGNEPRLHWVT